MKIHFIRHGQTDFNKQDRTQGQEVDLPLNETGIEQVESAMHNLPESVDVIISSPLKRAFETAEIINRKYNKEIILNDNIKEFSYGSLSGKTWPEIEEETGDANMREKDVSASYDYRPYGGESIDDVKVRVKNFIDNVKETYEDKAIIVATHGGIVEAIQSMLYGDVAHEAKNAEIYEFDL